MKLKKGEIQTVLSNRWNLFQGIWVMLLKSLRLYSYKSRKVDIRDYSKVVHKRFIRLKKFWRLKEEGASEKTALEIFELFRATLLDDKLDTANMISKGWNLNPKQQKTRETQSSGISLKAGLWTQDSVPCLGTKNFFVLSSKERKGFKLQSQL